MPKFDSSSVFYLSQIEVVGGGILEFQRSEQQSDHEDRQSERSDHEQPAVEQDDGKFTGILLP